jgi:hypothetical protein
MMKIFKFLTCVAFVATLVGCKSEIVETKVKTSDIKKSISGEMVTVPFTAVLQVLGDDENTRDEIRKYEEIIENYFDVEDFEISKSMMGLEIKVSGNLPVVSGNEVKSGSKEPWVLYVQETTNPTLKERFPYKLSLGTTDNFPSFKTQFTDLNMMLSPDPHQPLLMKIRNNDKSGLRVFTGSVEIQGIHHLIYESDVPSRISLQMKGGVYEHTDPSIFFNIQ